LALVSLSALFLGLSGPGCQPRCRIDQIPLTKDYEPVSRFDSDVTICMDVPPSSSGAPPVVDPPVVEPDVSGSWPADVGPKDPDAVVKMAILMQSCLPSIQVVSPRLNATIYSAYFEAQRDTQRQALLSRSGCFKDKSNGCDAVRECYGIVQEYITLPGKDSPPPKPLPTAGCVDGIRRDVVTHRDDATDTVTFSTDWVNCKGLGLECYTDFNQSWCTAPKIPCQPEETVSSCIDDRIYRCHNLLIDGVSYYFEKPRCSEFGLVCDEENNDPTWTPNFAWSDCIGTGAKCVQDPDNYWVTDDAMYDYGGGVACESETILRACVGIGEKQVDCLQLGKGFKCISEGRPHCGFAAECTRDTPVTCDGDSLVVCDAGRIRKVDCKTLGFTTCDEAHSACGPNILF